MKILNLKMSTSRIKRLKLWALPLVKMPLKTNKTLLLMIMSTALVQARRKMMKVTTTLKMKMAVNRSSSIWPNKRQLIPPKWAMDRRTSKC